MRRIAVVVFVLLGVLAFLLWGRGHHKKSIAHADGRTAAGASAGGSAAAGHRDRAIDDPSHQPRASIAGVVREKGGGPIAGATVCTSWNGTGLDSDDVREPKCTTTGADGAYLLAELVAASHQVSASAPGHVPRTWIDAATRERQLELRAGEHRTGIDIALPAGGVQVSGIVEDVNGGAIAGALVRITAGWWSWNSDSTAYTHSDAQGHFSLWADAGEVQLSASADDYGDGSAQAVAPSSLVEIFLTPESSLSGTVVEADSKAPVAGALVSVDRDWREGGEGADASARTDAQGHFHLTRLTPGRYKPKAVAQGGYGEAADSVLLGLGQSADGVVIELYAAATVRGTVVIDDGTGKPRPCTKGMVMLRDDATAHWQGDDTDADGAVEITSVLPGHYQAEVSCDGFVPRDRYDPVEVAQADLGGLVWTVGAGGTLRGKVTTGDGTPVAGAYVDANVMHAAARAQRTWNGDSTQDDGTYEMRGVIAGDYELEVSTDKGIPPDPKPTVTVKAGEVVTQDVVIDSGGTIAGTVSDAAGAPARNVVVRVANDGWRWDAQGRTGDDGSFKLLGVRPGVRRVVAQRGWSDELRKPGSSDDDVQGERVTVVAGKTATVHLVVERRDGVIHGSVRDEQGQPIVDAWVIAVRESERAGAVSANAARETRWSWDRDDRPVVTGTDGTFTVRDLAPGNYALRAYRKGGGEAIAEHVALGSTVALTIRATGTIAGTVTSAGASPPDEVWITLSDDKTGFSRREKFYRTGGAFTLRDLPAGDFLIAAESAGARATGKVTLATGEEKRGIVLALEANITLRGRVVLLGTTTPVPAMRAMAQPVKNGGGMMVMGGDDGDKQNISGDDGRFEIANAPTGKLQVIAFPIDWGQSEYAWTGKIVTVATGQAVVDIGDIEAVKRRVKPGGVAGDLGFNLAEHPPDQDRETMEMKVALVRSHGPADGSGLVAGDVIVSVDGTGVTGDHQLLGSTLLQVPPGTTVSLGLARGATVSITAGPPL